MQTNLSTAIIRKITYNSGVILITIEVKFRLSNIITIGRVNVREINLLQTPMQSSNPTKHPKKYKPFFLDTKMEFSL